MGPCAVTWSELLVSIQTTIILFPANLVIGRLFPLTQPREPLPPSAPRQAPGLSDAPAEPLSASGAVEVSLCEVLQVNPCFLSPVLEKASEKAVGSY